MTTWMPKLNSHLNEAEIKDIINYYIEEYSFIDSIDTIQTVNESENSNIKKEAKITIINKYNLNTKSNFSNKKK